MRFTAKTFVATARINQSAEVVQVQIANFALTSIPLHFEVKGLEVGFGPTGDVHPIATLKRAQLSIDEPRAPIPTVLRRIWQDSPPKPPSPAPRTHKRTASRLARLGHGGDDVAAAVAPQVNPAHLVRSASQGEDGLDAPAIRRSLTPTPAGRGTGTPSPSRRAHRHTASADEAGVLRFFGGGELGSLDGALSIPNQGGMKGGRKLGRLSTSARSGSFGWR